MFTADVAKVVIIMVIMAIAFFTEVIPLAWTALAVPVVLQLTGVLTSGEAWSGFSNSTIISWIGLFIVSAVLPKTSLTWRIKRFANSKGINSFTALYFFAFVVTMVVALLGSVFGAFLIVGPIVRSICEENGYDESYILKPCMDMVTWSITSTFPWGTSLMYVMLYQAHLDNVGFAGKFGVMDFTLVKLPMLLAMMVFAFVVLKIYTKKNNLGGKSIGKRPVVTEEEDPNDRHTKYTPFQETMAYILFFGNLVAMVVGSRTGWWATEACTCFFAVLTVVFKLHSGKEAMSAVSWDTVFLVACTLPLSTAVSVSGTGAWLASTLESLVPSATNPTVLAFVFCLICTILTQFTSNSASLSIFCPLAASMAVAYGIDPRLPIMACAVGSTICFATPMATTTEAWIYDYMGPERTNMKKFFKQGGPMCLFCLVIFTVWGPFILNRLYGG